MAKQKSKHKILKTVTSGALIASSFSAVVAPISAANFSDIENNYHKDDILQLLERGIIDGYPDGTFKPEKTITRGQAAKIIAGVMNLNISNVTNPNFSDVDPKHEFYPYIAALAKAGVINGYEDGTFKQDAIITRGQMAKMIALGFNLKEENNHPFTDVQKNSIYAPYIAALYNSEVTLGTTDTTYSPRNSVTRGQLASFVIRAEKANEKANTVHVVKGTVEKVLTNEIVIDGVTLKVTEELALALKESKQAFEGAKLSLTANKDKVISIEQLEITSKATSFNGKGLHVDTLSLPVSVQTLENITANTIHYHAQEQALTVNNVKATEFHLNNEKVLLASTVNVALPSNIADITFNSSTIDKLYSNVDKTALAKTNSTIKNIIATSATSLVLNGDFESVSISAKTKLSGSAKIDTLIFNEAPISASMNASISVAKVTVAKKPYLWNDFIVQYPNFKENNTESGNNDSSTGGETTTPGGNNEAGNSENNTTTPEDNKESENTEDNTTTPGGNNEAGETGNTGSTTPEPETEVIVIKEDESKVIIGDDTFDVTNEQKQFLTTQKDNIKAITLTKNENDETVIETIAIETTEFDGTSLNNVQVQNLTVIANTVTNVQNVDNLTVQSTKPTVISNIAAKTIVAEGPIEEIIDTKADTIEVKTLATTLYIQNTEANVKASGAIETVDGALTGLLAINSTAENLTINATTPTIDLLNSTANVIVQGQVTTIKGGTSETLEIASAAQHVEVVDVKADNIIIEQNAPAIVASLNMMRTIASTASMTVKFSGDYSGKTLTVKRKDTVVDVQSATPFSTVTVAGNGTLLNSNTPLANVTVNAGVTSFSLNANVEEFIFDLSSPIELSSTTGATIDNLIVTTKTQNNTDGYISLINVTATNITLDGSNTDVNNLVFKQAVSNDSFVSSITPLPYPNFGQVKVVLPEGLTGTLSMLQVPAGQDPNQYLNVTAVPANAESYSDTFFLEAATDYVIIYEQKESTIKESLIKTSHIQKYLVIPSHSSDNLKVISRYDMIKPLSETMGYIYIFDEGKLVYENENFTDVEQTIDKNGQRTFTLATGIDKNLDGNFESIITKDGHYHYSSIENASTYFVPILKELAKKANATQNPEMIRLLLAEVASKESTTFDSLFLQDYVTELAKNPNQYQTTEDILNLVEELTPVYQLDIQLSAADLYLNSLPLADTATYSVPGIVKVENATAAEKLLFTPLAEGTTTVRVTDKDGVASLINVTVEKDANGKLVIPANDPTNNKYGYQVIATEAEAGTLLDGSNNFRFYTNTAGTFLLPTELEASFALVQTATAASNPIGNVVHGYALTQTPTGYTLSAKRQIEPVEIKLADLGLTTIAGLTVTNIGALTNAFGDGIILFPRAVGNELAYFSDGVNITAVNITSSETTVTKVIAKSPKTVSISNDLKLDAITQTNLYPDGSIDIHYTNDGNDLQFYANEAANVAYVFSDSANKKTIVNVTSTMSSNQLTVADGQIVKVTLPDSDVTVTDISGVSVRAHGLDIFATQTGTSIITLSNGKQYEFDVKQTGNQFTIEYEEVQNVVIDANTLHMTNIKEATSSNPSDRLQVVNGKLVVNLAANGTSEITVKSNTEPVETTVLYVTKDDTGYPFDPATDIVRTKLDAGDLGLTTVTNAFGEATPTARIKVVNNEVYVYGFTEGTRSFRVNDGTNNTAINTTVSKAADGKLQVTATPITHNLTEVGPGTISSAAARLVGSTLYATGLGLNTEGKATIEVPMTHTDPTIQVFYTIGLSQHTDSKLLSFDATATKTFKKTINKADFDFSTLHNPTVTPIGTGTGSNISATINGDQLLITATGDDEARIQINESSASTAKAYIYIKRDKDNLTANIEKAVAPIDLKVYGYSTTPTATFSKKGVVRGHIDANLNVDFYALEEGKTAYKVQNGNDKNLFVNVNVTGTDARTVIAEVVEETVNVKEIIEGDAVRLSADGTKLLANKVGTKSIVKLADDSFVQYEVIEDANGQYELSDTPVAKSATITKSTLTLTGPLSVTGLNSAIASYSITDDGVIVYGNANGKTSMTVSDGSKSVVVNIDVTDAGVTITNPITLSTTATPTLIHAEDANIVRIDGTTVYALAAGVAEVVVDDIVQQITVKKQDDQYVILAPVHISDAVYDAADLGFAANAAMTIEAGYNTADFSVTNVDGKIVAYSKLATDAMGSTEFIVNASGERTLVNLKDTGADPIEATIAKQANEIDATATIANKAIARQKDGTLYALAEGSTHATVNGYIQAVDVTRNTNGLLEATVTPLTISGTFTSLTETDTTLIGIEADGIYVKKVESGSTVVQEGNQVYNITVKNTNGKITVEKTAVSSKTLLAVDAQLSNIEEATVLYGNQNAVTLSILDKTNTKNGLAIYSNTTTAQSLAILVTDSAGHKALINVVIDETGTITSADYLKETTTVALDNTEVKQGTNARGVWNGTTLTTYAFGAGNTALQFAKGLVNVTATKDDTNKVSMTATVLKHEGFTNALNSITNGAILEATTDGFYPIDVGSALLHADGKVYSVNVELQNGLYKMSVSNGVAFTYLDTTETYDANSSTLNGLSIAKDEDEAKLIIYKDGATTGTSDIVITSGGNSTVYHVKADATTVNAPEIAKGLIDASMTGATVIGNSIRLDGTDVYYLAAKASTLQLANNRLVTIDVTRDTDGYFTATPAYVTGTVTAAPAELTNYDIDGTTIYAKSTDVANATETVLITDPADASGEKAYYTTFSTTRTDDKFEVVIDERKAYQYDPTDLFGLTTPVTVVDNDDSNIATVEMIGNKLVVIAGNGVGDTLITLQDSSDRKKQLVIKATRQTDGTFVVTPQAALNNLLFADIDLTTAVHPIIAEGYDANVIEVKATTTGLNITAIKEGSTSLQLKQDGHVVGLVNITVSKNINGNLQITSTPITFTVPATEELYTNGAKRVDSTDATKFYATATGKTLFRTATGAQFIVVNKNATSGLYEVSNTAHTLAAFDTNALGLTKINSAIPATATVGTLISADQTKLYVYGQNEGTTDIVVSDGTSTTVIVATNGVNLATTVARAAITDTTLAGTTWTSKAPTVATARGGFIYTQEAGSTVLEATVNGHKVFMNVTVMRNENRTFSITPEVVQASNTDWTAVEVLTGADIVVADGTTLYAQQAGTATVKVTGATGTKVHTVTVTENTNGTMKMTLSQPMTHVAFTAAELGLTTLEKPLVNSINGAGVVTAQITNNELIVLAKASGQAEVTVNDGQSVIHFLVTEEAGELKVTPTIAKTTITGATSIAKVQGDEGIVRFNDTEVYALKAGKIIANVDGELYNINVVKEDNKLTPTVSRVEYEFSSAPTITDGTAVKVEGNKIVAIDFKSEVVTVDGKTYKVTVNEDGTLDVVLFAASQFDFAQSKLADIFADVTGATITSQKGLVNIVQPGGAVVSLTPKDTVTAGATDIITVSNGSQTVQLRATIEAITDGFAVTSIELVSKTLNASDLNNIYAATILGTDGQPFNSAIGVLRTENGTLTVYPGAAGEAHFIVRDTELNQSFFSLKSTPENSDASFEVKPVVLPIAFDQFGYVPTVLATNGSAKATNVGQDLGVNFADTNETVIVTTSGQNLYHTVLTKPKVSVADATKFDVSEHVIQEITPITGEITNVTPGLHSISHNGKTLIYATANSPTTAYFTDPNGIINKVTVGTNYALTIEKVLSESTVPYSSFDFLEETGVDVAALEGDRLAIKQAGTGIYKTNTNDYVKVTVTGDATNGYSVTTTVLPKKDLSSIDTSITVLAPTTGIYVDGATVYGETTEKVAVSMNDAIYTATITDGAFSEFIRLELDLTTALGWSEFASYTLVDDSQFGTIVGTTFIPKSINTNGEVITFTTAMGIKKQVTIKVNPDFTISATAGPDEIGYMFTTSGQSIQLTFDLNIAEIPEDLDLIVDQGGNIYPSETPLFIWTGTNTNYEGTFTLTLPEYGTNGGKTFTIETEKEGSEWKIPTITSSDLKFIHIVR